MTYYDENGVAAHTDEVKVKQGDTKTYTVNWAYTPDKAESRFDGWSEKKKEQKPSTDEIYANGGKTYTFGTGEGATNNDVTLYAIVTDGIWITYDAKASEADYTAPAFVKYGENAKEPTPKRTGYTFGGWYTGWDDTKNTVSDDKFNFDAAIPDTMKNATLYAKWVAANLADYTVNIWLQNATDTFKYDFYQAITVKNAQTGKPAINNGVTVSGTQGADNSYVKVGDTVVAPDFNKDTMSSAKLPFHLVRYDNVTVTPDGKTVMNVYYDRTEYTLTFSKGYTRQWRRIITALYGQDIADKFTDELTASSWTAQNSKYFSANYQMSILSVMPAEDTTFQAHTYSGRGSYPFRFYFQTLPGVQGNENYAGMTFSGGEKYTIKSNSLQSTKNEDWIEFEGFGRYVSDPPYEDDGTVSLKNNRGISFYYTRKSYHIVYNDGATYAAPGTSDSDRIEELTHNQISKPADVPYEQNTKDFGNVTPTKDGYIFGGWYDDALCTQVHDFDAQMPAHNVTVYAKWIQGGYTVTLDPDGGSMGGYTNPVNVVYNGRVPEPTIKREGYELIGWYTNKEKTKPYTFTYQLNKDTANTLGITTTPGGPAAENGYTLGTMNLYAKWRHVLEGASGITVVYDAGTGNKVNSDDQHTYTDPTKYQDQATASATGAATYGGKDGLKFQYWELTKKDGTKVKVYPGDTFTVDYNDAARSDNTDVSSKDKYVYTVTLKAVYDKGTPEQTQVIFDANGGSGEGYVPNATTNTNQSAASYDVNTPINIPTATLTREGYEFLGWSGTKKDEWTQEEWDAATEVTAETDLSNTTGNTYKLADGVTYYADNLSGFAESGDKTNTLYACWKPKYVTLVIQKEMSGAQANLEKGFTFTVAGADGTSKEGYTATTTELKDSTADTPDSPAKDGQFAAVTELSKDRTTVRLRWGDKVTITEGDHVGYKTSYSVSNGNGTDDKKGTIELKPTRAEDGTYTTTVVWTNTKENTVVTGIKSAGVPGALTAVGAAALAIAGGFAYVRRDETGAGAHARRRGRR